MNIRLTGRVNAIIMSQHSNFLELVIKQENGQPLIVCFDQFVSLISESVNKGDAIIVNCQVTAKQELRGVTIEFLDYEAKDQHQVATLPEKLAASYRKMMFMQRVSMELGQQFKRAGDEKNSRYYLDRGIKLRLEMPSLNAISQLCR